MGGGQAQLLINGTSSLVLTANDSYTTGPGGTVIQSGTLLVDGSVTSSTISADLTGTLGGTGTVSGFAPGGTVSPGDPITGSGYGILTAPSADLTNSQAAGSGNLLIQVKGYATAGTSYDQLNLGSGLLNLDGNSSITLDISNVTIGGSTSPAGIIDDGAGSSSFTVVNVIPPAEQFLSDTSITQLARQGDPGCRQPLL